MDLWGLKARWYPWTRRIFPISWVFRREKENLRSLLAQVPIGDDWILDVGTGSGDTLSLLPDHRVIACDRSIRMMRSLRRRFPQVPGVVASAEALPFSARSFPLVCSIGLMEYLQRPDDPLQEAHRILRPSGFLLITTSPPSLWNYGRLLLGHRLRFYRRQHFRQYLEAQGFSVLQVAHTFTQDQYLCQRL